MCRIEEDEGPFTPTLTDEFKYGLDVLFHTLTFLFVLYQQVFLAEEKVEFYVVAVVAYTKRSELRDDVKLKMETG